MGSLKLDEPASGLEPLRYLSLLEQEKVKSE